MTPTKHTPSPLAALMSLESFARRMIPQPTTHDGLDTCEHLAIARAAIHAATGDA
jgi:hypothetical protein